MRDITEGLGSWQWCRGFRYTLLSVRCTLADCPHHLAPSRIFLPARQRGRRAERAERVEPGLGLTRSRNPPPLNRLSSERDYVFLALEVGVILAHASSARCNLIPQSSVSPRIQGR